MMAPPQYAPQPTRLLTQSHGPQEAAKYRRGFHLTDVDFRKKKPTEMKKRRSLALKVRDTYSIQRTSELRILLKKSNVMKKALSRTMNENLSVMDISSESEALNDNSFTAAREEPDEKLLIETTGKEEAVESVLDEKL